MTSPQRWLDFERWSFGVGESYVPYLNLPLPNPADLGGGTTPTSELIANRDKA
jgi:hypothetical protein